MANDPRLSPAQPARDTYALLDLQDGPAIRCLRCGQVSHNPNDVAQRYCSVCGLFHEDAARPPPEVSTLVVQSVLEQESRLRQMEKRVQVLTVALGVVGVLSLAVGLLLVALCV